VILLPSPLSLPPYFTDSLPPSLCTLSLSFVSVCVQCISPIAPHPCVCVCMCVCVCVYRLCVCVCVDNAPVSSPLATLFRLRVSESMHNGKLL
jgi:hypothetical protein